MLRLILEFDGNVRDYEYDVDEETQTIMFHDIRKNIIILGKTLDARIDVKGPQVEHDSFGNAYAHGGGMASGIIKFEAYSFFKYNVSLNERFKIFWNERETVIWDTEEKKQVPNKDVYTYLQKLDEAESDDDDDEEYLYDDW